MIDLANLFNEVKFYVVQNDNGEFYRKSGTALNSTSWTTEPKLCRIYGSIGPARSTVTFFANNYPEYPILKILELSIGDFKVIDESARIAKNKDKKEAIRRLQEAEQNMKRVMNNQEEK